jgi:hypothetical protein
MIKYTPSKQVLHTLRKIRKAPYVLDKEYRFIQSCLPVGSNYTMHSTFSQWFDGFVFYSPVRLREVPLHGVLFPVSLFDEEEVL